MRSIGVYEAKAHFSQLLDDVAAGKTVTITRHGVPVACIVPPTEKNRQDAAKAWEEWVAIREAHNITLGDEVTVRDLIEEGRRY